MFCLIVSGKALVIFFVKFQIYLSSRWEFHNHKTRKFQNSNWTAQSLRIGFLNPKSPLFWYPTFMPFTYPPLIVDKGNILEGNRCKLTAPFALFWPNRIAWGGEAGKIPLKPASDGTAYAASNIRNARELESGGGGGLLGALLSASGGAAPVLVSRLQDFLSSGQSGVVSG